MSDRKCFKRTLAVGGAVMGLMLVLGVAGCAQSGTMSGAAKSQMPAEKTDAAASGVTMAGNADPDAQECADCAGKGMAPMVEGNVDTADGTQVITIAVKDGYYSPNQFKAKSGVPIKMVFSGNVKGCIGKPEFKSLGKKADFTKSGTATIDLGALPAGKYEFACGMGMTGGKLIVE